MLKKALITVAVFAALLMTAVSYLTARFVDHEEILRAKTEAQQLVKTRDSILHAVAGRDSVAMTLEALRDDMLAMTAGLRQRLDSIESARLSAQLGVRMLNSGEEVERKLRETYPAVKNSMRVADLVDAESGEPVSYFMVPLGFAESFVLDRQNLAAFKQKGVTLTTIDTLNQQILGYQKSITDLEHANRVAFQQGYDSASARYTDINQKYIGLLEKPPQVKIGFPHWGTIIASVAGGVLLGTQVK